MSAFIVTKEHVVTVAYYYHKNDRNLSMDDVLNTAKVLYKENIKSVNYRYNEKTRLPKLDDVEPKTNFGVYDVIKLIHCLDYQSCEHPDYYKSPAKKILDTLLLNMFENTLKDNANYDRAKWTI